MLELPQDPSMKLVFSALLSLLALGECRVLGGRGEPYRVGILVSVPQEVGAPVTVHPQVVALVPASCGVGTQSL